MLCLESDKPRASLESQTPAQIASCHPRNRTAPRKEISPAAPVAGAWLWSLGKTPAGAVQSSLGCSPSPHQLQEKPHLSRQLSFSKRPPDDTAGPSAGVCAAGQTHRCGFHPLRGARHLPGAPSRPGSSSGTGTTTWPVAPQAPGNQCPVRGDGEPALPARPRLPERPRKHPLTFTCSPGTFISGSSIQKKKKTQNKPQNSNMGDTLC